MTRRGEGTSNQVEGQPAKRIGLIVPSTNTVAEPDFYRRLPPHTTLHTARMFLGGGYAEDEVSMVRDALPVAVRDLATSRPDVVIFACTTAGAVIGEVGERELIEMLENETGAHVVSTNDAVRRALHGAGGTSIALITPYMDGLTSAMHESLRRAGLPVVKSAGMGIEDPYEIAKVRPGEISSFIASNIDSDIDAIFISCTNLQAFDVRDSCSRRFRVPVITSNQATLESATMLI